MSISPTSRDVVLAGLVLWKHNFTPGSLHPQTERALYHRPERAARNPQVSSPRRNMGCRGRPMEPTRQPRTVHCLHIQRKIVGILPVCYTPC